MPSIPGPVVLRRPIGTGTVAAERLLGIGLVVVDSYRETDAA